MSIFHGILWSLVTLFFGYVSLLNFSKADAAAALNKGATMIWDAAFWLLFGYFAIRAFHHATAAFGL